MENQVSFDKLGIGPFNLNRVAFSVGSIDIYWYADEFVSMVKKVSGKIDLNDSKILISLKNMRKEDEIGK